MMVHAFLVKFSHMCRATLAPTPTANELNLGQKNSVRAKSVSFLWPAASFDINFIKIPDLDTSANTCACPPLIWGMGWWELVKVSRLEGDREWPK